MTALTLQRRKGEIIGFDGHKRVKGAKIHALVTTQSLPVSILLGQANEHDSRKLIPLVECIHLRKPNELYADKAYYTFIVRWYLSEKRIKAQIPKRSKKRHRGRPPTFDKAGYKKNRSSVERFFSWLKMGFRRLAVRYERLQSTFLGFVHLACFVIHWRVLK